MLSVSSLIDFLLMLLRDDDAQAEFVRDPQGVLARHNLDGITAQDISEAEPMLADLHGIRRRDDDDDPGGRHRSHDDDHDRSHGGGHHGGSPDDDDPVKVIKHVTSRYDVDREVIYKNTTHNHYNEYHTEIVYDHSVTAGDGATVIQDSFNQDNDGVDNKGGVIDGSNVAGGTQDTVGNSQDNDTTTTTTTVSDEDTVSDDNTTTTTTTLSDDDTVSGDDVITHQETHVTTSIDDSMVSASYAADGPPTALDDDNGGAPADPAA